MRFSVSPPVAVMEARKSFAEVTVKVVSRLAAGVFQRF